MQSSGTMAMGKPRKGWRRITVGNQPYEWIIKPDEDAPAYHPTHRHYLTLVIRSGENREVTLSVKIDYAFEGGWQPAENGLTTGDSIVQKQSITPKLVSRIVQTAKTQNLMVKQNSTVLFWDNGTLSDQSRPIA